MSQVILSDDLKRLPSIVQQEFRASLKDEIAPAIAEHWQGRIVDLDVIDSRTYLEGVAADDPIETNDLYTINIESKPASGYASAIKRGHKGDYDYVGQRVAEEGIEQSDGDIQAGLDKAGKRVAG
jgi:hypothetical protein